MAIADHLKRHKAKWTGAGVGIAVALLTVWEGYAPVARHDRIDPPGVITVCFGMTNYDRDVKVGDRYTKEECQKFLAEDLSRYADDVRACVPGFDALPATRQAALVSFTYNLGKGALCKSSVARKINAGDTQGGCEAMLLYTRANGKFVQGLLNRRRAERELCLRDD